MHPINLSVLVVARAIIRVPASRVDAPRREGEWKLGDLKQFFGVPRSQRHVQPAHAPQRRRDRPFGRSPGPRHGSCRARGQGHDPREQRENGAPTCRSPSTTRTRMIAETAYLIGPSDGLSAMEGPTRRSRDPLRPSSRLAEYAELSQIVFEHHQDRSRRFQRELVALQRRMHRSRATPSPTKSPRTTEQAGGRAFGRSTVAGDTFRARRCSPSAAADCCNAAEPPKEPRHLHPLPADSPFCLGLLLGLLPSCGLFGVDRNGNQLGRRTSPGRISRASSPARRST